SFKEELKDCDQLWKLSQNKNALFWSMGICYSLLKTTGVEMWDQLFAHESSFIEKYGLERKLRREFALPFLNFNLREMKLLRSQEKEPWVQQHLTKSIIFFVVIVEKFLSLSLQYLKSIMFSVLFCQLLA
ncbi:hypothetical protein RFI_34022, partial [Reticulomyxa filosa]